MYYNCKSEILQNFRVVIKHLIWIANIYIYFFLCGGTGTSSIPYVCMYVCVYVCVCPDYGAQPSSKSIRLKSEVEVRTSMLSLPDQLDCAAKWHIAMEWRFKTRIEQSYRCAIADHTHLGRPRPVTRVAHLCCAHCGLSGIRSIIIWRSK